MTDNILFQKMIYSLYVRNMTMFPGSNKDFSVYEDDDKNYEHR